ncbi:dynamin family protein [Cryptosporidium muris RN66]|uniref:Dynamin family protein n=1 Tax=Cryptosporidium muris (strain RN66) TaxID=441375 RepID=B6AHC4_CRYMR|nr:dynamin family protein [Cryptosporidium muris RN66]EEA07619.1 dynamin family protein [Cryptosporidium muris RN66]|eukprot:XP_002141968.1 dynamin family protein [Cryptosporidium muris RN66]
MYQNLRKLISLVDELRDVGLQQYINLPRICVVGTQSSGKSSVLESVVGFDFLPRGEGIVTRRPVEMRLVHISSRSGLDESFVIFENDKTRKFTDFEQVRQEIDRLTDEVAGRNKGIVDDPIVLTIYGTQCPDLTLIDLPGITRVPLKGSDQCDNIEQLTRDMAIRYARDPRTIILAVIPANADMSTSDALQLSRRVDPKGIRTIGVITKIDLMDRGTDASRMLHGEDVPLRLGYIGVKNRSSADLKIGKTIKEALEDEMSFFTSHPIYRALSPELLGTKNLVTKLTKVLFRHIKTFLPDIKREINGRIRAISLRIEEFGQGVPIESGDRAQLMWAMITDYCEMIKSTIRGKYDKRLQTYFDGHTDHITSGSQIRVIFNELLDDYSEKDVTSELSDYDIDSAIRMHEGDSMPGFPSPDMFEYLILPHLRKIQAPVMDCLDRVTTSLEIVSQKIAHRVFIRFPKLAEQILERSQDILLKQKENTKTILEQLVEAETGYLFTNDSTYLIEHGSVINSNDQTQTGLSKNGSLTNEHSSIPPGYDGQSIKEPPRTAQHILNQVQQTVGNVTNSLTTNLWAGDGFQGKDKRKTRYSQVFLREIRKRLDSYFAIVVRNIRDSVPKIIGHFLVRQIMDKLQFELYNEFNKAECLSDLLSEPSHVVEERKALLNQLNTLKKASQVLQRDPNIVALNSADFDDQYDNDLQQFQNNVAQRMNSQQGVRQQLNTQNTPNTVNQRPMLSQNLSNSSNSYQSNQFTPGNPVQSSSKVALFASAPSQKQPQKDPLFANL